MASLGTLTLDLIARTSGFIEGMSKAERKSAKWRRQVKKDAEIVGKALLASTTALASAVTAITVQTARQATEVARLSQLANTTTTEFQRFAAGAKAVGIENDKLSDILKDVNDKVGDFLTTGGGPLLDFFEQIAPKVGVTAEQFRNLSGPQALQLYVDSLQQANLSQAELTFFMEAIANDATVLLPLMKNNGEGMREFADAAERAGTILDENTIKASQDLVDTFGELNRNFDASKQKIAAELLPVVSDLSLVFEDLKIDTNAAKEAGQGLESVLKGLTIGATVIAGAFKLSGKGIAGFAATLAALPQGLNAAKAAFQEFAFDAGQELDALRLKVTDIFAAGTEASGSVLADPRRRNRFIPTAGPSSPTPQQRGAAEQTPTPLDPDDEFLQPQEQFEDIFSKREEAFQQHKDNMVAIEEATNGQLSDAARQLVGEQSGLYKALFAIEKGAAIARSIVAIQTALANASASGPFPANLAAIASVASATAGIISTIASTRIQGQAHDGLMSVPKTGTYLLEKGERVTTADTSAKLDGMIDDARRGGMGGVRIVNAWDSSMIGDYMGSSAGERVIMNVVRKNQRTIKSMAAV
jgi:ParB-like chromosome segregation protein Spo0J